MNTINLNYLMFTEMNHKTEVPLYGCIAQAIDLYANFIENGSQFEDCYLSAIH